MRSTRVAKKSFQRVVTEWPQSGQNTGVVNGQRATKVLSSVKERPGMGKRLVSRSDQTPAKHWSKPWSDTGRKVDKNGRKVVRVVRVVRHWSRSGRTSTRVVNHGSSSGQAGVKQGSNSGQIVVK